MIEREALVASGCLAKERLERVNLNQVFREQNYTIAVSIVK